MAVTFAEALEQMDKGRVVARRGWKEFAKNYGLAKHEPWKAYRWVARNTWPPWGDWTPDGGDLFATDWEVVEAVRPPFTARPNTLS